ncbi:glycoside hydrolase family 13 protein [Halobacillus mangrovi]|uniref:glycoside hydrolase family 13 protein n=1 Tax=Halobacillus mangrovi TaxID=402384 RepID=UPI003D982F78
MLKEAIYHRPKGNYAYAYDGNTLHLRLRTKKDDVEQATVIWDDPFNGEVKEEGWVWIPQESTPMEKCGSTELYDYWFTSLEPEHKRLKYAFELQNSNETIYYTEKGFYTEKSSSFPGFFTFPYLLEEDVFQAPEWVKDTVWYQIFPERFANGNPDNNPPGALGWGEAEPAGDNFFGGDFEGIIHYLDHLEDLGVTGIYLTPIFKAHSNHKYDTVDYFMIDPQFGDKKKFKELVEKCHARGIKVMLDAVFNHCGFYFPPFQDVLEKGSKSAYVDWFFIQDFPLQTEPRPNYSTFGYESKMPKLNTANQEVRNYLLEVGRYWVKEFDIDGWRLDVSNEVSHEFWRVFRNEVKKIKPDLYILGEIWHDALPWLGGDQFDAVMNYPYTGPAIEYFAERSISTETFVYQTTEALMMYPKTVTKAAFNLLGSHDTPRIASICNENKDKVRLLFAFLLSSPGTPCIYYGDEIGMSGGMDPGCRKCMEWDPAKQDQDLFAFIKQLIQLRKEYKAIGSEGEFQFINFDNKEQKLLYKKSYQNETILFFINNSSESVQFEVPNKYKNLQGADLLAETLAWKDLRESIFVESYSIKVIKIQ